MLIGILLISILVFSFNSAANLATTYDKKIENSAIQKFNSNFEKNAVGPVEIQKIITMVYFAKDYNTRNGAQKGDSLYVSVSVELNGIKELTEKSDEELIEIMNGNTFVAGDPTKFQMYECKKIEYDNTGMIREITYKKI